MSLRYKFIIALFFCTLPMMCIGILSLYLFKQIALPLQTDIPKQIQELSTSSSLGEKAIFIRYYDEVLTQSARNYAFTGDIKWKTRYEEEAPKLDAIIQEAILQGDEKDKQIFSDIDSANSALVAMEEESMTFVGKSDLTGAQAVLDSTSYAGQKELYQRGLTSYINKRGLAVTDAILNSTTTLETVTKRTESIIAGAFIQMSILILISVFLVFLLLFYFGNKLIEPLLIVKKQAQKIADGHYDDRIPMTSQDELGELAHAFNTMTEEVQKTKEGIEKKVKERTMELEKVNSFMTKRELNMIELKQALNKTVAELETLKKLYAPHNSVITKSDVTDQIV